MLNSINGCTAWVWELSFSRPLAKQTWLLCRLASKRVELPHLNASRPHLVTGSLQQQSVFMYDTCMHLTVGTQCERFLRGLGGFLTRKFAGVVPQQHPAHSLCLPKCMSCRRPSMQTARCPARNFTHLAASPLRLLYPGTPSCVLSTGTPNARAATGAQGSPQQAVPDQAWGGEAAAGPEQDARSQASPGGPEGKQRIMPVLL